MAFKRSAGRSRLSPPKALKTIGFQDFFFVKMVSLPLKGNVPWIPQSTLDNASANPCAASYLLLFDLRYLGWYDSIIL